MDLKEFVTKSLTDIVAGIMEAQRTEGMGGLIAPDGIGSHQFAAESGVVNETHITSTVVKFDVAITAEHAKSGVAGAGVKSLSLRRSLAAKLKQKTLAFHGFNSRCQF
jgi:hypothetical protein